MAATQIALENVQIGFKNFAGVEGPYNTSGDRNFVVFLSNETAEQLANEGWNVKFPKPVQHFDPDRDYERDPYLPVAISFNSYPPKVVLVTQDNVTRLDESTIDMLDWADIESVDIVIRPYNWSVGSKSGVKAYTKALYVTIRTDAFDSKYGI